MHEKPWRLFSVASSACLLPDVDNHLPQPGPVNEGLPRFWSQSLKAS